MRLGSLLDRDAVPLELPGHVARPYNDFEPSPLMMFEDRGIFGDLHGMFEWQQHQGEADANAPRAPPQSRPPP